MIDYLDRNLIRIVSERNLMNSGVYCNFFFEFYKLFKKKIIFKKFKNLSSI